MRDKVTGNLVKLPGAKQPNLASGNFVKVLVDMVGRVIGTTPVVASDIEAVVGSGLFPVGTAFATGNVATERGGGLIRRTRLTLSAAALAVPVANKYAGLKIYTFPEGRILLLGAIASLQWAVTTNRASTIINNASLTWALGSVVASNVTLATTMLDEVPTATKVLSAAAAALNTASNSALAASAQFDGTTTPKDVFLNGSFITGTDILADGTLTATGYVDLSWINLGDF